MAIIAACNAVFPRGQPHFRDPRSSDRCGPDPANPAQGRHFAAFPVFPQPIVWRGTVEKPKWLDAQRTKVDHYRN